MGAFRGVGLGFFFSKYGRNGISWFGGWVGGWVMILMFFCIFFFLYCIFLKVNGLIGMIRYGIGTGCVGIAWIGMGGGLIYIL